ncbi:MAG: hypothetical protein G01um10145_801 [Microgenomates group bacterium Gr01-1014_5]|nr:MAG: hypothetical protein G01um10145_801 [Microgenomates group bacterium Gr01-1014_5]
MRTNSSKTYLLVLYFFIAGTFLFLDSRQLLGFIHTSGQKISDPARKQLIETKKNFKSFFAWGETKNLEEKIVTLNAEKAELLSRLANYKAIEDENKQMRRLLDSGLPKSWKFTPAQVISRVGDAVFLTSNTEPAFGTVVIAAVANADKQREKAGVYVGKTEERVGNQIKTILATETNSKIPVIVRDKNSFDQRASGILEGRGGRVVLEQVLSRETINEGDLVLTSGEVNFPGELLLGSITKVLASNNSALQQAEVKTAIDLSGLTHVFFITKY